MGQVKKRHIWVLLACFALTAFMVHRQPAGATINKPTLSLPQVLERVEGWKSDRSIPLESNIIEALRLDDYLFQSFSNEKGTVTLYIGYYHTAKKVGAAHDPMVCYPGQGWRVAANQEGQIALPGQDGNKVAFSTMTADLDGQKELVLYWFQAHDQAVADTFSQKLGIFRQKVFGGSENNAFVRITSSLQDQSEEEARELIMSFVQSFYPTFLNYVKGA